MIEEEIRPEERAHLKKLYKARLTIASMMRQRGYLEPSNSIDEKQSYEDFEAGRLKSQDEYLYFKASDYNQKMYVSFERDRKVEEDRIIKLEQRIKQGHMNAILLVLSGDPNNGNIVEKKARTKIELFNQEFKFYSIELFNIDDLVFDITKHELVPQHIPISDDEKKALLIKYRMTEAQLPRILLSDPMAKFLGLKHGNVVKIVRKSETAGVYVTYRIAI